MMTDSCQMENGHPLTSLKEWYGGIQLERVIEFDPKNELFSWLGYYKKNGKKLPVSISSSSDLITVWDIQLNRRNTFWNGKMTPLDRAYFDIMGFKLPEDNWVTCDGLRAIKPDKLFLCGITSNTITLKVPIKEGSAKIPVNSYFAFMDMGMTVLDFFMSVLGYEERIHCPCFSGRYIFDCMGALGLNLTFDEEETERYRGLTLIRERIKNAK